MVRYIILGIYPLLFVASAMAAYQTSKLSRNFPSKAWTFKRRLMAGFMIFQVYGLIRTWAGWSEPIYLIGVLLLCIGINIFDYLLLQDARSLRATTARLATLAAQYNQPLASGELAPEEWDERILRQSKAALRSEIKPEFLK